MEILNIKDLTFKYPAENNNAVENVSLSINKGDFVLICGASGSGKTTLIKLLKPELSPYGELQGNVTFCGDIKAAVVTQNIENQIVSDQVWHNMAFALESENKDCNEIRQKVAETAEYFGISHLFRKNTFELSGGEKQLVNLASVMVTDPDILLLDEPTSQLDPIAARSFIDIVRRLNEEMNITVIICEHRTEELYNHANRRFYMDMGKLFDLDDKNATPDSVELPVYIRLFNKLGQGGERPANVSQCQQYLSNHFLVKYDRIEETQKKLPIAIQLVNIYFKYKKELPNVLNGINLNGCFGEILAVLGGNGSGKSTVLSLIAGVNKPFAGKIKTNGKKAAVLPQNVKTVFTKDVLKDDFSVITTDYVEICEKFSLCHLLNRNPYDLSGGEAQKAALVKILLTKPDILCLDEPTKGIDAKGKREIRDMLKNLAMNGMCVILVSHDADFIAETADRCAFLFDGEIVSDTTPREMFSKNRFYTTSASRVSRHMFKNAVTEEDIVNLCKRNDKY